MLQQRVRFLHPVAESDILIADTHLLSIQQKRATLCLPSASPRSEQDYVVVWRQGWLIGGGNDACAMLIVVGRQRKLESVKKNIAQCILHNKKKKKNRFAKPFRLARDHDYRELLHGTYMYMILTGIHS